MKRDMIPCPTCRNKVFRKNAQAVFRRCKTCFKTTCDHCRSVQGVCVDCYIKEKKDEEIAIYFEEKRMREVLLQCQSE